MKKTRNRTKHPIISLRKWYRTREGDPVNLWCMYPETTRPFPVKGHILTRINNRPKIIGGTWTRKGKWPESIHNMNHDKDLIQITQDEWNGLTNLIGISL